MRSLVLRVAHVRRRLRDGAAASVALREQQTVEAELARDELEAEIAAQEAEATARIVAARGGRDLLILQDEAERWRDAATLAAAKLAETRKARDAAVKVLVAHARELEKLERHAETLRVEAASEAAKAEQKQNDDLGAARVAAEGTR